MKKGKFRAPSQTEQRILELILSLPFEGRDELIDQVASAKVRTIDSDGSIEISPRVRRRSPVPLRVPVIADTQDADGVPIRILLHVVNGVAEELEIFRGDDSPIQAEINPSRIKAWLSDDWELVSGR